MNVVREIGGWQLIESPVEAASRRVLLLPGLMGSDRVFASLLAEPSLARAGLQAVAANPPGFKGLPVPRDFDFSVESYAALVETLTESEPFAALVGHSYFANVLIEVAARGRYQGRLVLISPSLDRAAEAKDLRTLDRLSRNPIARGVTWWATYLGMKSVFRPYFNDEALLDDVTAAARLIPRCVARRTLIGFFDHLDRHGSLAPRLAGTRIPVCYLRGAADDIGFTAAHRQTLAANPLISLQEINAARHFAMCDQPAAVAQQLVGFC